MLDVWRGKKTKARELSRPIQHWPNVEKEGLEKREWGEFCQPSHKILSRAVNSSALRSENVMRVSMFRQKEEKVYWVQI